MINSFNSNEQISSFVWDIFSAAQKFSFLQEMDNLIKSVFHKSEYSIIVFLFPLQQGDLQKIRMLKQ